MKNKTRSVLFNKLLLLLICAVIISCSKKEEEIVPDTEEPQLEEEVNKLGLIGNEGTAELITNPSSVEKIDDGYKIEGGLEAEIDGGKKFNIAEGSFEFIVDINGKIIKISGEGMVDFPNVGVFEKIRENFTWEKIKSHIEYDKGRFFKDTYLSDIPLNDDRYYFHFRVFDESDDEGFSLKHLGNLVVYNFTDFYLDINDPAVFFKVQLWKPGSGAKSEATSIAKKLFQKAVSLGKGVKEYASAPGIVFGISNQATITSTSYEFSKPEVFEELFGYNGFDEINSHLYLKLKNVPIPETVILRLTGDMYVHGPLEKGAPSPTDLIDNRQNAFVDWFNESEIGPVSRTFNGSMDFGGKGIGAVFGILDGIDNALGYDILNSDFNFDLVGAAYQEQTSGLDKEASSFLRFGGEFRKPILAELFGPKISKFIPGQPVPTGFLYFNIEDDLDKWSLFIESSADINIPTIGKKEFSDSYFLLNKDGLLVEGNLNLPTFGILNFDRKFRGVIGPDGFDIESEYNHDITLPNGISLGSRNLVAKVSSDITKGFYLEGSVELPLGITEANVLAIANSDNMTFNGDFTQQVMDLGYGFDLPSRSMTFSASTDQAKGIYFKGEMDIPHLSYNLIEGEYNAANFSFTGIVNKEIDFNGVKIPLVNGDLTLNSGGISLGGSYSLPFGLQTAQMAGSVTAEELAVSGKLASGIKIGGYTFNISNSYINASSLKGVNLGGYLNLKVFTTKVDGTLTASGFSMTGTTTYSSKFLVANINVVATQSAVNLSGTGTVYGLVGNKLASGNITFKPNWAAGTMQACINGYCIDL